MEKTIILLRGCPGAGKSSLANILSECQLDYDSTFLKRNWPVISADDYFLDKDGNYIFDISQIKNAHAYCETTVAAGMKVNIPKIFVANTFTQEWEMEPYFKLAKEYGYKIFTIIVENRHESTNVHNVPPETITKMKNRFQIKL
jgi:predicted kinase